MSNVVVSPDPISFDVLTERKLSGAFRSILSATIFSFFGYSGTEQFYRDENGILYVLDSKGEFLEATFTFPDGSVTYYSLDEEYNWDMREED